MTGAQRTRLRSVALLALAVSALALPATAGAAPRGLVAGFFDENFQTTDAALREPAFDRAVAAGTGIVRVNVRWAEVAPLAGPPADPANPADPGYEWGDIDAAVRRAAVRGILVMFTVYRAPRWAQGADRPQDAAYGTWKPNPTAYGRFARALATRYGGRFADPERPGSSLPRVRFYEAWNEPNLDAYLAPQWQGRKSVGPGIYRRLLNSFYSGVKAAQPGARVIAPATAPYGDRPGSDRTPPVLFLRTLLCLRGGRLTPVRCPAKARFDILSHHPINSVAGPRRSARNPLDASTPDIGRLTRVLRKAERTRRVLPAGRHRPVWGTELWWESDPPDEVLGIPLARQARYLELAEYVLWQQGVRVAVFFPMIDDTPGQSYIDSLDSGIFFHDGRRKPSFAAFRFPLATQRLHGGRKLVWGKAPCRCGVRIQRRTRRGWRTVARAKGRPGVPFTRRLRLRRGTAIRAIGRGIASRAAKVR